MKLSENTSVNEALKKAGTFGRWQVLVLGSMWFVVSAVALNNICIIFMQFIPEHYCDNELYRITNWTTDQIAALSFPNGSSSTDPSACSQRDLNYSKLSTMPYEEAVQSVSDQSALLLVKCHRWRYDRSVMNRTIATDWDLVCDNTVNIANIQMMYTVGYTLSCVFSGHLTDHYGRRKSFVIFGFLASIFGIANALVTNFYVFLVVRMCLGYFNYSADSALYVWVLEMSTDRIRKLTAGMYSVAYSCAFLFLALLAWYTRDWRTMHMAVSAYFFFIMFYACFIPESPVWLASQGRTQKAEKIIHKIAVMNKKSDLTRTKVNNAANGDAEKTPTDSVFSTLFKNKQMRRNSCIIFILWPLIYFVYGGNVLLTSSFSGNIFVNNALAGLSEIPAMLIFTALAHWSRKKGLVLCSATASLAHFAFSFLSDDWKLPRLCFSLFSRLLALSTLTLLVTTVFEMYPTKIKSRVMNLGSFVGRTGILLAPYVVLIAQKDKTSSYVPMLILGLAALLFSAMSLFLKESITTEESAQKNLQNESA